VSGSARRWLSAASAGRLARAAAHRTPSPPPPPSQQPLRPQAWHPSQPLVATGCYDAVARVWDLRTGGCVRELRGHQDAIQDIAFSPDGGMLITGSDDNTSRIFAV